MLNELGLKYYETRDERVLAKIVDILVDYVPMVISKLNSKLLRYKEEVLSYTLMRLYANIDQFNTEYKFSTWITTIIQNKAINMDRYHYNNSSKTIITDEFFDSVYEEYDFEKDINSSNAKILISLLKYPYNELFERHFFGKEKYNVMVGDYDMNLSTLKTGIRKRLNTLKNILSGKEVSNSMLQVFGVPKSEIYSKIDKN